MPEEKQMPRFPIKPILWGLLCAVLLLFLLLGIEAYLVTKEVLPLSAIDRWLYGTVLVAAFVGARFALRKLPAAGGTLLPCMVTATLFFILLWCGGLLFVEAASFQNGGLWLLAASELGGLLASLLGHGRQKKRTRKKQTAGMNRTKRKAHR